MTKTPFSRRVIGLIQSIPAGRVATYGQIADMAGNRRAARQVARLLHSASCTEGLPWHRVVNARGMISLPRGRGYEEQKALLETEGIVFDENDRIEMKLFRWVSPV